MHRSRAGANPSVSKLVVWLASVKANKPVNAVRQGVEVPSPDILAFGRLTETSDQNINDYSLIITGDHSKLVKIGKCIPV